MKVDVPCPACCSPGIEYTTTLLDVPYFKDVLSTLVFCEKCGFKHNDIFITGENEPQRFEYDIGGPEDMCVRVIRSTSGTLEVPQLGIRVEPGGSSEAYVTNIEGIIQRMEMALRTALNFTQDAGKKEKALALLSMAADIRAGKAKATLVLEDPMGNSAIVPPDELSDRMKKRPLTEEERKRLSTGIICIEPPEP